VHSAQGVLPVVLGHVLREDLLEEGLCRLKGRGGQIGGVSGADLDHAPDRGSADGPVSASAPTEGAGPRYGAILRTTAGPTAIHASTSGQVRPSRRL
jgi:hypothetical protein